MLFTDVGLTAYDGADALDVVVRSLKTAKAMTGVRVALVAKDGENLAAAQSDGEGHVRFDHALLEGEDAGKAVRVMAYGPNADFTLLDLERSPIDLSGQLGPDTGRDPPASTASILPRPWPSTAIFMSIAASTGRAKTCTWWGWCAMRSRTRSRTAAASW